SVSPPPPPYSSGNGIPIRLSAPSLPTISYGNDLVRSSSSATGATSPSANSRTVRRISSWSGGRSKSIAGRIRTRRGRLASPHVNRSRLVLDFLTRGEVHGYGPRRAQRADLYLPLGAGPHPVMVTVHGGAWSKRYGRSLMRGLAGDLVRRG